jgi:hypothetical protein
MEIIEIAYGPEHGSRLRAILGEGARNIANEIYLKPERHHYQCADGRYVSITERVFSSTVFVFQNREDYQASQDATWATYPDPETGRFAKAL